MQRLAIEAPPMVGSLSLPGANGERRTRGEVTQAWAGKSVAEDHLIVGPPNLWYSFRKDVVM
jgi:hypothetical protein